MITARRATPRERKRQAARASLITPPGWSASPGAAEAATASGETGGLRCVVEVPPGTHSRHVCCAELTLGERPFGQIVEALVDEALVDLGSLNRQVCGE